MTNLQDEIENLRAVLYQEREDRATYVKNLKQTAFNIAKERMRVKEVLLERDDGNMASMGIVRIEESHNGVTVIIAPLTKTSCMVNKMLELNTKLAKTMGEPTYLDGKLIGLYFTVKNLGDFINQSILNNHYAILKTNLLDIYFSNPLLAQHNVIYFVRDMHGNLDLAYLDSNTNEWSSEFGNIKGEVSGYADISICIR